MQSKNMLILTILVMCLASVAYAAENATSGTNWGSDGPHHEGASGQASVVITPSSDSTSTVAAANLAASNELSFTPTSITGNCLDNTKKVAVYMPAMTNQVYSESTSTYVDVPVTYDPLTTAMFYEYNPDYIGDSNLTSLTTAQYDILIVPMTQMSNNAATAINTYIANGGSVWFLNDPCLTPTGSTSANRINILGTGVSASISSATTVTVVNTDEITRGLQTSFKPVGTTSKTSYFRSMSGNGTVSGMNYQVLMGSGTNAMLIKFENPTNGARVIYSNPNIFVSGGTSSYFDAKTATKLFMQTKAWVMNLAQNPSGISITYPNGDKQLTVTCDDVEATSSDISMSPMYSAETSAGVTPSDVNTFFVIPSANTNAAQLQSYTAYGDIHTLHPHLFVWDTTSASVAAYKNNISSEKNIINTAMSTGDYGFTSWRFPMTTFCANSMQAVSESGFIIESSSGIGTDGIQIGNAQDNTILFPKQLLINNAKSNLIEMEIPGPFDIDCSSGTDFYNQYNANTSQFKYGNFPMNFVVGCHYQGAGVDGLTEWNVTATGLSAGLGNIVAAEKAVNTNFANFNTLANYINGVKSATITAAVSGNTTTVTVVNTKEINNFTIKVANGTVISATCDGVAASVKQDTFTNSSYITKTISAGTHTFVIVGTATPITNSILPVANFTANVTSGTAPLAVLFTSTSTNADNVSWTFGDGSPEATTTSVEHTFTSAGTYIVTLTSTNANGTSSKNATISVSPQPVPPVASFTVLPTSGTTETTFSFTDTSTYNPTSWAWTFGDGDTATTMNPTHKYSAAGTYTVNLTVTNNVGNTTTSKTVNVTAPPQPVVPVASFSISPTSGTTETTFSFTDTSTNTPTSWAWTFGDGGTATTMNPTHKYSAAGTYTVSLTAINSAGNSTTSKTVTVVASTIKPPLASFKASTTAGAISTTFKFTDISTRSPASWSWDFGDGETAATKDATHSYAATGTYTVSLTVANSAGSTTATKLVTVLTGKPVASFTYSPTPVQKGATIQFTDTSINNPTRWKWTFGDGTESSTLQNPSHVFANSGSFKVSLTVYNTLGSKTIEKTIRVS